MQVSSRWFCEYYLDATQFLRSFVKPARSSENVVEIMHDRGVSNNILTNTLPPPEPTGGENKAEISWVSGDSNS